METVEIARIDSKKLCNAEELTGYVTYWANTDSVQCLVVVIKPETH